MTSLTMACFMAASLVPGGLFGKRDCCGPCYQTQWVEKTVTKYRVECETHPKEVEVIVCKPRFQTVEKDVTYTVRIPEVREVTKQRCVPVVEWQEKPCQRTVMVPVFKEVECQRRVGCCGEKVETYKCKVCEYQPRTETYTARIPICSTKIETYKCPVTTFRCETRTKRVACKVCHLDRVPEKRVVHCVTRKCVPYQATIKVPVCVPVAPAPCDLPGAHH